MSLYVIMSYHYVSYVSSYNYVQSHAIIAVFYII